MAVGESTDPGVDSVVAEDKHDSSITVVTRNGSIRDKSTFDDDKVSATASVSTVRSDVFIFALL